MNNELKKQTKEELEESKRKCWFSNCKKIGWIEDFTGYKYCFKHCKYFLQERSLLFYFKNSKFNFKKLLSNILK